MSMLGLGIFLIFLWLLFFLYRKIPNKSIFFLFLLVLIISAGFAAYSVYLPNRDNLAEQNIARERIIAQQEIFGRWYADYQRLLEMIDYNWQQHHQIITSLRDEEIDQETAFHQMIKLERDCQNTLSLLAKNPPPASLSEENYSLALQVYRKTTEYAEAQTRTIGLCREAADPENIVEIQPVPIAPQDAANKKIGEPPGSNAEDNNIDKINDTDDTGLQENVTLPPPQNDINHRLHHIMLTEAPAGLFTAKEISALRSNLSLPEELDRKSVV